MKRIVIIALALLIGASARSQGTTKLLESNFMLGAGLFGETGNRARDVFPGAVQRLSYGLDVRLGENWSVMPGAGIRSQIGEVNLIKVPPGEDREDMSMADVFCQARYHFEAVGKAMVAYIGPQFSYMVSNDRYYIDADPSDPRGGKEKFKTWDIALQPGIIFRSGKHWQWGFEASVGLRNMLRQYPEYGVSGCVRLHNLMFVCGWHF